MVSCIRIARLQSSHQAVDGRQEIPPDPARLLMDLALQVQAIAFPFMFELAALQRGVEGVMKFIELNGLEEVAVGAGIEAFDGGLAVVAGGDDDDADVGP